MRYYDYVIVGAGFYGAVLAEQLARTSNKRVLVMDKRPHIGGNAYSATDPETGTVVHEYGAHIFHTNSKRIWDHINRFGEFRSYHHKVMTTYQGRVYPMPISLGTINSFFGITLKPSEVDAFIAAQRGNIVAPKNLEEKAISLIGEPLYRAFIEGYTYKQWARDPKDLPASIITRLPVRSTYNSDYFNDRYQGLPVGGYTPLFERMLDHPQITVALNEDFFSARDELSYGTLVYSGPLDAYFGYSEGRLDYRTVVFDREVHPVNDYQGIPTMNYADRDVPYTRVHEYQHYHPEVKQTPGRTVIFRERSKLDDGSAPYYPINDARNEKLAQAYRKLAQQERGVVFGGRLGDYQYYDMDQVIGMALKTYDTLRAGDTPSTRAA